MTKPFLPPLPNNTLFFDIETGGIDTQKSSIVSISYGENAKSIRSLYAQPLPGSYVSNWANEKVFSQIQHTTSSYLSEHALLVNFLTDLQRRPANSAIAGWNIGYLALPQTGYMSGFDIPAIMQRASKYGMGEDFRQAFHRLAIRDVGREFLTSVSIPIHKYMSSIAEGQVSKVMDPEIWHQMRPYAEEVVRRRAEGYSIPDISRQLQTWNVAGWRQEQAIELLLGRQAVGAHFSQQDVAHMIEITTSQLPDLEGAELESFVQRWHKGALRQRLIKQAEWGVKRGEGVPWDKIKARATRFGDEFFDDISQQIQREKRFFVDTGKVWSAVDVASTQHTTWQKLARTGSKIGWGKIAVAGAAIVGAGLYALQAGKVLNQEDEQVEAVRQGKLIEMLEQSSNVAGTFLHGRAFSAGSKSPVKTDFSSPWQGPVVSGPLSSSISNLPTKLMGISIDPSILSFRADVINDKEARRELDRELRAREKEAVAKLGEFESGDFIARNLTAIKGINRSLQDLRTVQLDKFVVNVEDADTLLLRRPGAIPWVKSLFGYGEISIRLAGIDAPETTSHQSDPLSSVRIWQQQVAGDESTEVLRQLLAKTPGAAVVVSESGKTYGRYLGAIVGNENQNLNLELLRRGAVTALPFGEKSEELVSRRLAEQAETEARANNQGVWQYARYKAIHQVHEILGRPITHNVLTRIDRLAPNLNLGAYASFLQGLGDEERDLTADEDAIVRRVGYTLRKTHGDPSFRIAHGARSDHNTIEGFPHQGIGPEIRQQMTPFGSGVRLDKLLNAPLAEQILSASTREASEELVANVLKTTAGRDASVSVGGIQALLLQKLNSGVTGDATLAWVPGKGQAVLKTLKEASLNTLAVPGEVFSAKLGVQQSVTSLPFGRDLFTYREINQVAKASGNALEFLTAREAGLMKAARAEYGSIVPELYGHEGSSLLMEYAGTPLKSVINQKTKISASDLQSVKGQVESFLEKTWGRGNVVYMDPHSGNVAFKRVGNDVQVKMLDWGGSLYRSELKTRPLSPEVLRDTIQKRMDSYDDVLQNLATTVMFGQRNHLQELQRLEEHISRQSAGGKGPYIEGLHHGGLNEQMRHKLTPFGGPIDWIKNLFGGSKRQLASQLERQGVVVIPQGVMKKLPKEYRGLSGAFVSEEALSDILSESAGSKAWQQWINKPSAAREKLFAKGSGVIVSEATLNKGSKFVHETVKHEQLHELFYSLGMSGESASNIAVKQGSANFFAKSKGFAQFREQYMQSSKFYATRPHIWEEEYLAHARGSMARGMSKQEKVMYSDAVQFLSDKLPQAGQMSSRSAGLQWEMAKMQREAQAALFKGAKYGGKGHCVQKR